MNVDNYEDNEIVGGCELHEVVGADPLDLGAVKLETDEWAWPVDPNDDVRLGISSEEQVDMPMVGDRVFVMRYDGRPYWIGTVRHLLRTRCDDEEDEPYYGPIYDEEGNLLYEEGEEWKNT